MFENITMSDAARQMISAFFKQRRIPHAIILEGTTEDNRMMAAKLLAAAFVCESEAPPCLKCRQCMKVREGVHPDVIVFDKESGKTAIGVDTIRKMKSSAFITANDADKKVFIFKEAQTMTVQSQNALLKIFEEPPEDVAIIMTCDSKETLLETVLSRGTVITLGQSQISGVSDKLAERIKSVSRELCESFCSENEFEFMKRTAVFEKEKVLLSPVAEMMASYFASAAVIKSGGSSLTCPDRETAEKLSQRFTLSQLVRFVDVVLNIKASADNSANANLTVTRLSSTLANARTKG
ncbi:MAG: hypothetical protein PUB94_04670 [Oscillospiraceae bacterium]|nr:hypothetical protein [Oscillospiraceae bacterium]